MATKTNLYIYTWMVLMIPMVSRAVEPVPVHAHTKQPPAPDPDGIAETPINDSTPLNDDTDLRAPYPENISIAEEYEQTPYVTVITANRSEIRQFEASRSMEVIGKRELEKKQLRSLPEVVGDANGVFLQQTNRGAGAPIIRGLLGPWNLILVDGVRFNTSTYRTGPNQYLATLDQFAVEKIEIVRGPSSVLYGSGAMGGVMQFLTVSPDFDENKDYDYSGRVYSSFASADLSPSGTFELSSKAGPLSMLGGGSYSHFFDLRAGNGEVQPLSGYSARSARAKAVYSPDSTWSLIGAYFGTQLKHAGRTDSAGVGDVRIYDNADHLAYISFQKKRQGIVDHLKLTVSYHRLDETVRRWNCTLSEITDAVLDLDSCIQQKTNAVERKLHFSDIVDVLGGDASLGLRLLSNRLSLNTGGEFYQEFVSSHASEAQKGADGHFPYVTSPRGNFSNGSTYRTAGVFLHGDMLAVKPEGDLGELHVLGGARFSNFGSDAEEVPDFGDVHYSYNGVVFSCGLQWLTVNRLNIFALFNQGFRAPNLLETTVFKNTGSKYEIPNDNLKPENSNTFELGTNVKFNPLAFSVSAYYSIIENVIDEMPSTYNGADTIDGVPVVRRMNAAKAWYRGVEGSLTLHLWRFTLASNITYTRGDVKEPDGESYPGRRIPPLFGRVSVAFESKHKRYYSEVFTDYALSQDRLHPSDKSDLRICETSLHSGVLDESCDGSPAWYTLNLKGGVKFFDWLRTELSVLNVTDNYYRPHGSGFYASGVDARITLLADF